MVPDQINVVWGKPAQSWANLSSGGEVKGKRGCEWCWKIPARQSVNTGLVPGPHFSEGKEPPILFSLHDVSREMQESVNKQEGIEILLTLSIRLTGVTLQDHGLWPERWQNVSRCFSLCWGDSGPFLHPCSWKLGVLSLNKIEFTQQKREWDQSIDTGIKPTWCCPVLLQTSEQFWGDWKWTWHFIWKLNKLLFMCC